MTNASINQTITKSLADLLIQSSDSAPLVKTVDYFRQQQGDRFFEVTYEQRQLKWQYSYERGVELVDDIIIVKIGQGQHVGTGECSPFPSFFNWPVETVMNDLRSVAAQVLAGATMDDIDPALASPARSGIDLALIDLHCRSSGKNVFELFGLPAPHRVVISQTVEYEPLPDLRPRMKMMAALPLLKVKLGSDGLDAERLALVREYAPQARIIVDVNEGWTFAHLQNIMPVLLQHRVEMIEQPLKHGEDADLVHYRSPIPVYADESFMGIEDIERLADCYDGFNIKLDKIGGLTNALRALEVCAKAGKSVMIGCLGGTSLLSTAGFVAAQAAQFVDLDNHLWLSLDREPALGGENGIISPPAHWLWGAPAGQ